MIVRIVEGDLLDQRVDAIVNSWNRNLFPWWLLLPQGVSGAIKRRAGTQPFRELRKFGVLKLGDAVSTSAGALPFKAIIHVAGIGFLWSASENSIRDSGRNAVKVAEGLGVKSLAFPVIGGGVGSFTPEAAEKILRETLEGIQSSIEATIVRFKSPGS